MQGDPHEGEGRISRSDVAAVLVSALGREDCYGKTFEIVGDHGPSAHRVGESLQRAATAMSADTECRRAAGSAGFLTRRRADRAARGPGGRRRVLPVLLRVRRLLRRAPGARNHRHHARPRAGRRSVRSSRWLASIADHSDLRLRWSRAFRRSIFLPWIYGSVALALAARRHRAARRTRQHRSIGAVLLRVHQRAEPVHRLGVLELPARAVRHAARASGCSASSRRAAPRARSSGPLITDLAVEQHRQQRHPVSRRVHVRASRSSSSACCCASGRRSDTAPTTAARRVQPRRVRGDRPIGGNPFAGFTLVLQLAVSARHRAVRRSCSRPSARSCTSSSCGWSRARSPIPTERTRVFARLDWIVQSAHGRLRRCSSPAASPRSSASRRCSSSCRSRWSCGFLALAATGTFMVLAVVFVLRRVGEYAFVRPGARDAVQPAR